MAEGTLPLGESLLLQPWPGCAVHVKRTVLRPIVESVLRPIAENVLRSIAESVLRPIAESVLRPIAENSRVIPFME